MTYTAEELLGAATHFCRHAERPGPED